VSQGRAASAASVLFNLPGYRVLHVVRDEVGARTVTMESVAVEGACPSCGVFTSSVHQRTLQRVRDVAFDGPITVLWRKKRWRCWESSCDRASFAEHTAQVPPRARLTTRLATAVLAAVTVEVRAVDRVAVEYGLSWPTVARLLAAAARELAAAPIRVCHALGIDEHRFRSVRWFKDDAGSWRRIEPWSAGVHRPGHRRGAGSRRRAGRGRRAGLATV
jgi:transposase